MGLTMRVYDITKNFPEEEKFGLTNQIRRASVSIASNIAEGASRTSEKDFKRFLEIALGSSFEVLTQIKIAQQLKYISDTDCMDIEETINSISKQLVGLSKSLIKK